MMIERIFTRPVPGSPQTEHTAVRIVAGAGIAGDRYSDKHDEPGQNITFVAAEEIEAFLEDQGLPPAKVVKCLVHKAGLHADALSSGELALGAAFQHAG